MVAKPEYEANAATLDNLGVTYEDLLSQQLRDVKDIRQGLKVAHLTAGKYHGEFEDLLASALAETGNRVVDHYDAQLGLKLTQKEKQDIVSTQIMRQVDERYYGATLGERLTGSRLQNASRIEKSARTGQTLETRLRHLSAIFMQSYPYGAQVPLDKRILLSQSLKLEHDVALETAKRASVKVTKWYLSDRHKVKDICDDYATEVNPAVAMFLKSNNINVNPEGCYFVDEVPRPPHPNCQCYLRMVHRGRLTGTVVDRVLDVIRDLLGRLRRRRRKTTLKV